MDPNDRSPQTNAKAEAQFPQVTPEQIRAAVLRGCESAIEAARRATSELPQPVRGAVAQWAITWASDTLRFENSIVGGDGNNQPRRY